MNNAFSLAHVAQSTDFPSVRQRVNRRDQKTEIPYTAGMAKEVSPAARQLRALRDRTGLSREKVGERIGMPATSYQTYESDYKRPFQPVPLVRALLPHFVGKGDPPITQAEMLALAGVSEADLAEEVAPSVAERSPVPNARIATDAPPAPSIVEMPRDVPVYGTAQGGPEGAFVLNMEGGPIDWARRPQSLMGVQKVFAIYVEGDSMVPWRQPGELVYAYKGRSPAVGNHVIVVFGGSRPGEEPRAMIKRLAKRTAGRLDLEQYNPPTGLSLDLAEVREVIRVLEWAEIMGV